MLKDYKSWMQFLIGKEGDIENIEDQKELKVGR